MQLANHFNIIRQNSEQNAKAMSFLRKSTQIPLKTAHVSLLNIKSRRKTTAPNAKNHLNSSFISVATHQKDIFEDLQEDKKRKATIHKDKMRKICLAGASSANQAFEAFFSTKLKISTPT